MVAVLFVTGFMSAGLTAPLVGVWADQQYVTYVSFTAVETFDSGTVAGAENSVLPFA
jgi:hypothetical protein